MSKRSPAVIAATAFNRIASLRRDCEDEIKRSPTSIKEKFAEREQAVRDKLTDGERKLLDGMLAAAEEEG